MSAPSGNFDFRAMGQELRSNPKTQIALGAFALVLLYALYSFLSPDTPKGRKPSTTRTGANLDPRQLQGLRRLPDLAALGKAGELPPATKVQRDLFMFEAPLPPPPPAKVVVPPPPPPPSAEELQRQKLAQEKATEFAGRPQDLRYLGFFKGSPSGTVGAFMKGEEPVTLVQGTLLKERWKLVSVLDTRAEFQNTKYPDLRVVLEVREASGSAPVNQVLIRRMPTMSIPSFVQLRKPLLVAAVLMLALGCTLHKANKAFDEGRYDEAVYEYRTALRNDPTNTKARIGIKRASQRASEFHLSLARQADMKGFNDTVIAEVRKALVLDPESQIAQEWLVRLEQKAARDKADAEALDDLEVMKAKADAVNALQLNPRSIDGIDLNFSRKTSLREIFATLSKASGVNIIAHSSYQDQTISIDLRGLPFQRVLDTLMLQNDLFYKVIDKNTIMVFKATPQNREQYENQIIKTYYLSFADPAELRSTLTTLNNQLKVFTDKRTNAIIVKAKPVELAIVDQVIRTLDKGKAEVMVYFELMEVTENSLEQVGLLPVMSGTDTSGTYRFGATTVNNTSGMNTNTGFTKIPTADIRVLFPNLALDFLKSNGDARLVASPNVRVVSGETGDVNIGEKISTTQSQMSLPPTGTSQTNSSTLLGGVGQTSFSYEDVGVKIKVEPRVHNNNEITLKIESAVTTRTSETIPGRPNIGRREIKTSARLRDGETAIFGGLLKDEEQKSLQGIWGLSDIPLIGKLLGNTHNAKAKTDVILTIRAVLVRRPVLTEQDMAPFNPEDAAAKAGPFSPEPPKKAPVPAGAPVTKPATTSAPATPGAAPVVPAQKTNPTAPLPAPALAAPGQPPAAAPTAPPATPPATPPAAASEAPLEKKPNEPLPAPSDLVIFMSPVASEIKAGEKVRIGLTVSGGGGLSSGTLELRLPPGLRLLSVTPGEFLTGEGGSLEQFPGKDGLLKLVFKRSGAGTDAGPFVTLDLEGLTPGNAPVLIQSGQFLVGTNPISGRWSNALVTVL